MGVGEICFEFGLMLGCHDPQLQGGVAAVIPASARQDRGQMRASPEQASRKVLLVPPSLPGLRSRPTEAMRQAKAASRPVHVSNPELKRNDNH